MLRPLTEWLRRGQLTESTPYLTPPRFRGQPVLDPARCRGHAACDEVCPTDAIEVGQQGSSWSWRIDRAACVSCGLCAEVCPTGALSISPEFELAARRREDLVITVRFHGTGQPGAVDSIAPPAPTSTDQLRRRLFRSSLHVRHLDVGSDNGADWELNASLNPLYDLQRFGIDFVASPRHADLLVVTGAVTRNLLPALLETYEATPAPKLVMALGADACSGGITRGSYAALGGVDQHIPVDVYVPGDPPRPGAIVHGLLLALGRREQKRLADGVIQTTVPV